MRALLCVSVTVTWKSVVFPSLKEYVVEAVPLFTVANAVSL